MVGAPPPDPAPDGCGHRPDQPNGVNPFRRPVLPGFIEPTSIAIAGGVRSTSATARTPIPRRRRPAGARAAGARSPRAAGPDTMIDHGPHRSARVRPLRTRPGRGINGQAAPGQHHATAAAVREVDDLTAGGPTPAQTAINRDLAAAIADQHTHVSRLRDDCGTGVSSSTLTRGPGPTTQQLLPPGARAEPASKYDDTDNRRPHPDAGSARYPDRDLGGGGGGGGGVDGLVRRATSLQRRPISAVAADQCRIGSARQRGQRRQTAAVPGAG